jgi:WNK lysine deficient protein kinase
MAEQVELPQGGIETATELIGAFMLILIRHWRPSISTPQHSAASPQALTCYCD